MFEAANQFDTAAREKAMIALLRDTGLRIGAVLSFQLKHVNFETRRGTLTINDEANVKGDDGPKVVIWSRSYVSNWLDIHPRPDDPEAALIHKTRQWSEDEDGALSYQYASRRIKDIVEVAGLDPEKIKSKLFRATAISDWIRDDLHEQKIKTRTGWAKDSRMFKIYSRVSQEEMNEDIFDHYGIEGGDDEEERPIIEACYLCDVRLAGHEEFCPGCGAPLSSSVSGEVEAVGNDLQEYLVEMDDIEKRRFAASTVAATEHDPALLEALVAELQELGS